jgi:twinkle protein
MVKYRPSRKINKGETKCWCQKDADTTPILFNINRINATKPLLITSGEIDCLSAIEAGYLNAVSIPLGDGNTHWVEECWNFLEQFDQILICSDNDESGRKFQKDIIYRLGSWRTKVVEVPLYYERDDGTKLSVKDLNETLYYFGKDKILDIIYNAKDTPVPSVDDLSDVDDIDLTEIDGVTTGINALDKELMKFFYGTLTIISGMPGSGKSSLLCQLTCNALDEGKNTWMFSGELPEFMVKTGLSTY